MSLPSSLTPLFSTGSSAAAGGYQIERSLRFNSADSAYLSRTPAGAGNRKTWTWAGWVKKVNNTTSRQFIFNADVISNNSTIEFSSNAISVFDYNSSAYQWQVITSAVFRDNSAWLHIVVAVDTTQGTASNRVKVYVNGTQQTFSTANYPTQDYQSKVNATVDHRIGSLSGDTSYNLDGYLANIHFIDGQQLDPSSFTEVSATTGQLVPIAYTGGSYGTNGFYLQFADNSTTAALGTDTSGNGNTWTVNNISASTGGPTSVASASGALPVFNTTDTYGAVKGTGTRTDTNSASLVLALSMDGANGGSTFTDESATIRGSGSAKSITVTNTTTSTAQYKFYGSAALCGSGKVLTTSSSADFNFGTGDFTIEYWLHRTSLGNNDSAITNYLQVGSGYLICLHAGPGFNDATLYLNGSVAVQGGTPQANVWNHYAYVRSGTTCTIYKNGIAIAAGTSSAQAGSTNVMNIGAYSDGSSSISGYMQDVRMYKGLAKYTSNFNPPTSTANPTIAAGNDSLVDTPTSYGTPDTGVGGEVRGNYATWNAVNKSANTTLSNGNLNATSTVADWRAVLGTIGMSSGKWYWEITITGASYHLHGIAKQGANLESFIGIDANGWGYYGSSGTYHNSSYINTGGFASYTTNDVIGVAFDADNGSLYFYKNGTVQNSGNAAYTALTSGPYFPAVSHFNSTNSDVNFGQRAFAYQTPGTNRPAATFKALCDTNLGAPLVAKPNTLMDVITYTGTGAIQTLPNANSTPSTPLAFSPDFVWLKDRSGGGNHNLYDSVRGATLLLYSNLTLGEGTSSGLTAFTSDGFTLGANQSSDGNLTGRATVAWAWDAGTSTVSNTAGSITSQVRANASAGFSVATWSGSSSNST
jgi:hypothetical protein